MYANSKFDVREINIVATDGQTGTTQLNAYTVTGNITVPYYQEKRVELTIDVVLKDKQDLDLINKWVDTNKTPAEVSVGADSYTIASPKLYYEYKPYVITTSVEHGTIDATQNVGLQETKTINFASDAGYILKNIVVDGNPYYFTTPPTSYTFKSVVSDHSIDVVYEQASTYVVEDVEGETVTPKTPITAAPALGSLLVDEDDVKYDVVEVSDPDNNGVVTVVVEKRGAHIINWEYNDNGDVVVHLNDGTTITIPKGEKGKRVKMVKTAKTPKTEKLQP